MSLLEEIQRRRTFGIISHPDAGKTTLTEKFLLFGGAIQTAGAVKSNKIKKTATSDFMDIERQRGISVATSVMSFDYEGVKINLLDTPGHKDFAEDTYRTLTAVDSVILVIDSVKGVEAQTEKLMEVCRMRNTPVITFINKLDREGMDPLDILAEIEDKLQIECAPLSWPIGMGKGFKGVYNIYRKELHLFTPGKDTRPQDSITVKNLDDKKLDELLGSQADKLREEAAALASKLAEGPPIAIKFAKQALNQGSQLPLKEGLKFEARAFKVLSTTEDVIEGISAFFEKRKPEFKGK